VSSTGAIWEVSSLGFASEFVVVGFFFYSTFVSKGRSVRHQLTLSGSEILRDATLIESISRSFTGLGRL